MDQSVIAYRSMMLSQRGDWQSTGAAFNAKALTAANAALVDLATMFPGEVLPDIYHQVAYGHVLSDDDDVRARVDTTTDSLVLMFLDETGVLLSSSTVTTWTPAVDGTWDGVMWLEIIDPDGQKHRRQSLEWWREIAGIGGKGGWNYYVSIDRPWRNLTDTGMQFRIVQEALWFPGDIVGPKVSGRLWDGDGGEVTLIDKADARDLALYDNQGNATGTPQAVFQGTRRFELAGPRTAPVAEPVIAQADEWIGPWQTGTSRFFYTYVWGRRDAEWQDGQGGIRDPVWESPPSPVSTAVAHTVTPFQRIHIEMTNVDEMLGFGDLGALRYGRSGRRLRIYVMNDAFVPSGIPGTYTGLEADSIPYLLAEVDPTTPDVLGSLASFTWDGSIPDLSRRYRRSTGYIGWHLYPHPDDRYEIDFDISRFPRELSHDRDVVPVREDAGMVYLWLLMARMAMVDGNDLAAFDAYQTMASKTQARLKNNRRAGSGLVTPNHYGGGMSNGMPRTGTMGDS